MLHEQRWYNNLVLVFSKFENTFSNLRGEDLLKLVVLPVKFILPAA